MKWFAFKLVALLGVLLAAPLFIPGPDGEPIMTLGDWIPRDFFNSLGEAGEHVAGMAAGSGGGKPGAAEVYSWRDENGTLHFSDTPVEGATAVDLNGNSLEIPARRFIQHGTRPVQESPRRGSGQSFLLRERNADGSSASGSGGSAGALDSASLEALVGGDYSKAGEVLKNLPALVEQAKQARAMPPDARSN